MLLLSVLIFELIDNNWERIDDAKEGEPDKHFAQFVIISL